jgi:hypothetical protein
MAGLTRGKVAEILGVSLATVRRMEGKTLHPRRVDGAWRFDPEDVARVQRTAKPPANRKLTSGDLAAKLFHRFDQGQSLRKVVEECHQEPDLVRNLYREWATPLGETPDDPPDCQDDERYLQNWEKRMMEMMAADEELSRQDGQERQARRERRSTKQPHR